MPLLWSIARWNNTSPNVLCFLLSSKELQGYRNRERHYRQTSADLHGHSVGPTAILFGLWLFLCRCFQTDLGLYVIGVIASSKSRHWEDSVLLPSACDVTQTVKCYLHSRNQADCATLQNPPQPHCYSLLNRVPLVSRFSQKDNFLVRHRTTTVISWRKRTMSRSLFLPKLA